MAITQSNTDQVNQVIQESKKEVREATLSPFVELLTRIGFGARGAIYLVMGIIAVQVVQGSRSAPADQQGALAAIGAAPFGNILLSIVMVGFAGYALWGVIRAVFNPLHLKRDAKGLLQRFGFIISAVTYGILIPPIYGYLTGDAKPARNGAQTAQIQQFALITMTKPWGRWVVGLAGICVIGVGLATVYQGLSRQFEKQFELYDLDKQQAIWIKRIGRMGTSARGIVFALTGLFLFQAAYRFDPHKAQGIDGALMALVRQPYGPWLLGFIALGLIAFGIYSTIGAASFRLKR